nr:probable leucine-rich repeat receptor-like serine/threonine-protein kinase At3g14840 [Tanacetum cinerariifolium]
MLFLILCVVFVPFGFASIETTCLPSKEVDTLRVIGRTLGKQWDFKEDPCSVVTVVNKINDADTVSDHKVSDDTVSCSREPNATICHVIAV